MTTDKKEKCTYYFSSDLRKKVSAAATQCDCSMSEFIERAVLFYIGYLNAHTDDDFLPEQLVDAIETQLASTMSPMNRQLFKVCTELDLLSRLLALTLEITPDQVTKLRGQSVEAVKRINGVVTFEKAAFKSAKGEADK